MRELLVLACVSLLVSCEFFISTAETTQSMVREELNTINWNAVDHYPLFKACDETAPKAVQRQCFESAMLAYFSQALKEVEFQGNRGVSDTVYLHCVLDTEGFVSIVKVEQKTVVSVEVNELTAKLAEHLRTRTPVKPAIKRGIPVRMRFTLPLVLNSP